MPRKKNNRKKLQAEKQAEQPKPKRTVMIVHTPYGASSAALALAVAAMAPAMVSVDVLHQAKEPSE